MPSDSPSNETLSSMLRNIEKTIDEHAQFTVKSFETVITKQDLTNGRIKRLEMWRSFLIGVWSVLTFLLPIFFYQVAREIDAFQENLDNKITNAIQINNDKYFEPITSPNYGQSQTGR